MFIFVPIIYISQLCFLCVAVQPDFYDPDDVELDNHHIVKRIVVRKMYKNRHVHHFVRYNSRDPKKTVTETIDVTDTATEIYTEEPTYPPDYFLPESATDPADHYDYDQKKFNKPYLTKADWRDDMTNKTHRYTLKTETITADEKEDTTPNPLINPIQAMSDFRSSGDVSKIGVLS